jgi:hypothetical protein
VGCHPPRISLFVATPDASVFTSSQLLLPHSFCFLTAFTSSQFLLPHSNASVHNSLNIQQERMAAANAARAASDHAAKQAAQVTCTVGSKADEEVHRLQELLTSQASVQHV